MPGTKIILPTHNRITNVLTVLKNGGAGPPLYQHASYPMANLLNKDRWSVWHCFQSGGLPNLDIHVQFDLGASANVRMPGYMNLRAVNGGFFPSGVVFSYRTTAQGYSSDPLQYTGYASYGGTSIDVVADLTSTSMQYINVNFQKPATGGWGNGFYCGGIMAANNLFDLVISYSPGERQRVIVPQLKTRLQGGPVFVTKLGDPYRLVTMPFISVDASTRSRLEQTGVLTDPFVVFRHDGITQHCLPIGEFVRVHKWTPPDLYDIELDYEVLQ